MQQQQQQRQNIILYPTPETHDSIHTNDNHRIHGTSSTRSKRWKDDIKRPLKKLSDYFTQAFCCFSCQIRQNQKSQDGVSSMMWPWRWLKRTKRSEKRLVWCFRRALVSPSVLHNLSAQDTYWTRFEAVNERKLTKQYNLFVNSNATDSIDIQDRNIFDGTVTVRIIFQEAIAFAVDPECSEPINFEIISYPKVNWLQKWLYDREARRRWHEERKKT